MGKLLVLVFLILGAVITWLLVRLFFVILFKILGFLLLVIVLPAVLVFFIAIWAGKGNR